MQRTVIYSVVRREGMFAIRLLPPTRVGLDGQRLGEIVVGDLRETFACHSDDFAGLEDGWMRPERML